MSPDVRDKLRANLSDVRGRIARAAESAGRSADAVRLVAVTKQVDVATARELPALGVTELGESRPQELWHKHDEIGPAARWHLIGPLQRNKARRTLPIVELIHSVDSIRLLEWLDVLAGELTLEPRVLLEVNVSGEAAKHGFGAGDLPAALDAAARLNRIRVSGLMTMAPYDEDPERARPVFAALRELRDRLLPSTPPNCRLDELSMGMSGDFEPAVAEGATIVRIGSALFREIEERG